MLNAATGRARMMASLRAYGPGLCPASCEKTLADDDIRAAPSEQRCDGSHRVLMLAVRMRRWLLPAAPAASYRRRGRAHSGVCASQRRRALRNGLRRWKCSLRRDQKESSPLRRVARHAKSPRKVARLHRRKRWAHSRSRTLHTSTRMLDSSSTCSSFLRRARPVQVCVMMPRVRVYPAGPANPQGARRALAARAALWNMDTCDGRTLLTFFCH